MNRDGILRLQAPAMTTEVFLERFAGPAVWYDVATYRVADGVVPEGVDADDPRVRETVTRLWASREFAALTDDPPPAPPTGAAPLRVRVNEELTLEAGWVDDGALATERVCTVYPPSMPMLGQLLAYLREKPDPGRLPRCSDVERVAVAATALCLRWGSFFAVLADRDLPLWEFATSPAARREVGRIDDFEMARINVEASAALAELVDLLRAEWDSGEFIRLAYRAAAYLPMPFRAIRAPSESPFYSLSDPTIIRAHGPALVGAVANAGFDLAAVRTRTSRAFANAVMNAVWRHSRVEDIHAGRARGLPLDRRRVTPAEERQLLRHVAAGWAPAFGALIYHHEQGRPLDEVIQLYPLARRDLPYPSRWTLRGTNVVMRLDQRYYVADPLPRSPQND